MDNGTFFFAVGWFIWVPLVVIGILVLGSAVITVAAALVGMAAHLPGLRGQWSKPASVVTPEDSLEALFGAPEK